jgi:hypothetical protein
MKRPGTGWSSLWGAVLLSLVGCATVEPEIPSCSACELKLMLLPNTATAKGSFSTVDTSVFKESRVVLSGATGTATVSVPLPTGGTYSRQVSYTGTGKLNSAVMEFRYQTSFGDLRWASKNLNLPITPPFSSPFSVSSPRPGS